MKSLLRLTVIGFAAVALSGGHGGAAVPEDCKTAWAGAEGFSAQVHAGDADVSLHGSEGPQDAERGISGFLKGEDDGKEYGRHDFPALTGAGEEMFPARTGSCAARTRSFQGERDGGNRQLRSGFCRGGKVVCTAHPCNFMIEHLTAPVRGAVSGLLSAISLRRLRI